MRDSNDEAPRLLRAYTLATEWLKYAELKNGVLITFNGAMIFGLHQLFQTHQFKSEFAAALLWTVTSFLGASLLVGLASFYARTKPPLFLMDHLSAGADPNIVFFGDIATMTPEQLLRALCPNAEKTKYQSDLASQTVILSRLAAHKFAIFNLAFHLAIAGLISPPGWLLYYWKFCDEKL